MRPFSLLLLCLLIPSLAWADLGAFLLTKSVYLYKEPKKKSKKLLFRRKQAYSVIGVEKGKSELWLKIAVPSSNNRVQGSGYILENDSELTQGGRVKVYSAVPSLRQGLTDYLEVESGDLFFTGRKVNSPDFPVLIFRAVNYKSDQPRIYWVPDWGGVYRVGKEASWLNEVMQELRQRGFKKEVEKKILNGLVEQGFSMEQVRLSLGPPLEERSLEQANQVEWSYPGRKVIFEERRVIRQI